MPLDVTVIILGLIGNGLVIFVVGYKMKALVNSTWRLQTSSSLFLQSYTSSLWRTPHQRLNLQGSPLCAEAKYVCKHFFFVSIWADQFNLLY